MDCCRVCAQVRELCTCVCLQLERRQEAAVREVHDEMKKLLKSVDESMEVEMMSKIRMTKRINGLQVLPAYPLLTV